MKKIIGVLAAHALLSITLAACTNGDGGSPKDPAAAASRNGSGPTPQAIKKCPSVSEMEKAIYGRELPDEAVLEIEATLCVGDYVAMEILDSDLRLHSYDLAVWRNGKLESTRPSNPATAWNYLVSCENLQVKASPVAVKEFLGCGHWKDSRPVQSQKQVARVGQTYLRLLGEAISERPGGDRHAKFRDICALLSTSLREGYVQNTNELYVAVDEFYACEGWLGAYIDRNPWLTGRSHALRNARVDASHVLVTKDRAAITPDGYEPAPIDPSAAVVLDGEIRQAKCYNRGQEDGILMFVRYDGKWKLDQILSAKRGHMYRGCYGRFPTHSPS
ncbi:hypothetical protein [Streptomyces sp. 2A115]|uniref:hypothetical protein n=1 Tax=Streptomyces sp. 2A115 TaxID=3457439 RepID=UPI003FD2461C